jgi:hypothetical protein
MKSITWRLGLKKLSRVTWFALLLLLLLSAPASAAFQTLGQATAVTLNVRAFIDGRSHLIVQGDTVHWHHLDFAAPGRHAGADEPTYLNGTAWYPIWPDVPTPANRDCDCDSSCFVGVPPLASQAQTVVLGVVQARWSVAIIQQPDQSNGYTLIIEFDDNPLGSHDWYEINLVYATTPPSVAVDIKPRSCPNPLNVKSRGKLPVAILGTDAFDVEQIDPASVRLEGVAPLRWALEDVVTPYEPFTGKQDARDCTHAGPDGYPDLTLKFETQELVAALGDVDDREVRVLQLTGNLKEAYGGTSIVGEDVVVILKKGKK